MGKQHHGDPNLDTNEMLRVLSEMQSLMLQDPAKLAALSQEAVSYTARETGRPPEDVAELVAGLSFDAASEEERHIFRTYFSRLASSF